MAISHAEQCPLQSIVDGEINVAQAAAFMVLLHSKVMLHAQHDLLVAVVQVSLHTSCAILTQLKLLLACMHSKHTNVQYGMHQSSWLGPSGIAFAWR